MLLCVQVPTLLLWEQRDVSTTDQVNDVVKKTIEVETEETEAILTTEEATTMIEIVEVILTTEEVMTKTEVETEVILVVVSSFSLKKKSYTYVPGNLYFFAKLIALRNNTHIPLIHLLPNLYHNHLQLKMMVLTAKKSVKADGEMSKKSLCLDYQHRLQN